ncbi:MAG: sulfatase-like hydrolase/transferase [Candidatus Latescibacterota bacterium]|nr:sulfatase-like hydrolase/transferase [Candidatus Latescibacterota bacterium]
MEHPNIIIFQCDQLRAFELGCYGNTTIKTPNIDYFSNQGFRFETSVCNNPVCMASRSSLMAGQYSRSCTGDLGNDFLQTDMGMGELEPEMPESRRGCVFPNQTLPEILKGAGYQNTAIGKWHIRPCPDLMGFHNSVLPLNNHRHSGQNYSFNGGNYERQDGFGPEFEFQQVDKYLQKQKSDQPFFLYYNVMPPHMPLADMPEEFVTLYEPNDISFRENIYKRGELPYSDEWFKIYLWDYLYYHYRENQTLTFPMNFDLKKLIALYYGAVSWVDSIFGRLLTSIAINGLEQNTIVLFISDHGDQLGSHHRWNKGVLFEESVRIPQIWRWPGKIKPGNSSGQVASSVDIMPTLLEACSMDIPDSVQGQSLFQILKGEIKSLKKNHAFIETSSSSTGDHLTEIGVRTPTHVLGLCLDKEKHEIVERTGSMYDLRFDPYQQHDLFSLESQIELKSQLLNILKTWHKETKWLKSSDSGTDRTKFFDHSGFSLTTN